MEAMRQEKRCRQFRVAVVVLVHIEQQMDLFGVFRSDREFFQIFLIESNPFDAKCDLKLKFLEQCLPVWVTRRQT